MSSGRRRVARTRARAWGSWAGLALAVGCAPELEPEIGALVERGEHVEVWASDGLEVCGGNVAHMDRFVERFREVVGPRPEAEARHRYYVLDEEDWALLGWCDDLAGCTIERRTIYARRLPSRHELVHAEIAAGGHSLLEEGIAEAFGDGPPDAWPFTYDVEEALDLGDARLPFEGYQRAAHFSRFLIDRYGIDGFLRLRDSTSKGEGREALARAFEVAVDRSLESELIAYEGYAAWCQNAGYRLALLECELPVTPWRSELSFVETVELTCAGADVLGPFDGEIFTYRALEMPLAAKLDIEVEAEGTDDARAWIVKCGSRCRGWPGDDPDYPLEPPQIAVEVRLGEPREATLYPGRYWIRMSRPVGSPGALTLRVEGRE